MAAAESSSSSSSALAAALTPQQLAVSLALLLVAYKTYIYVYRLYFHPLSSFPGPRLCAASRLYEFYHDSVRGGRLWADALPQLHDRYGPVVRMGPDEVHVRDPAYFFSLFGFRQLDKWPMAAEQFGLEHAMFATADYRQYTARRAAYGDAFSRSKSWALQPLVGEKVEKAWRWMMERAGRDEGRGVVDLAYLTRAVTAEIMTEYMYGQQYGFLEDELTTRGLYDRRFDQLFGLTHLGRFVPFWIPLVAILLRGQVKRRLFGLRESMAAFLDFTAFAQRMLDRVVAERKEEGEARAEVEDQEEENQKEEKKERKKKRAFRPAVDVYLASPAIPASDKTGDALVQATQTVWAGGWDTTAFSLTLGLYHVLRSPRIQGRLRRELDGVWPPPSSSPPSTAAAAEEATKKREEVEGEEEKEPPCPPMPLLDPLPYLSAVTKETLRLTHGALARLTRVNPTAAEECCGWTIPPGTRISMSLPDMHLDKGVFGDDVETFRPERWLPGGGGGGGSNGGEGAGDRGKDEGEGEGKGEVEEDKERILRMDKHLVAFSRGTRVCLGQELAWMELKMVLAAFVGRYDAVIEEDVTDDDVVAWRDGFTPGPKNNFQRLPVKVKRRVV